MRAICLLATLILASTGAAAQPSMLEFTATQVATGEGHSCALTTSGAVKCWGYNDFGRVYPNFSSEEPTPIDIPELANGVVSITVGRYHSCALLQGGTAKCWGSNSSGQLGDGTGIDPYVVVDVAGPGGVGVLGAIAAISAGDNHTCALMTTGGAKCWGLITGTTAPVDVPGHASGLTAIASGQGGSSCAITSAGGVSCWGGVSGAVTGLGSAAVGISGGITQFCAVTAAGAAKCWSTTTANPVPGLAGGVSSVSVGGHLCAVMTTGGAKCLGNNDFGQLGDNSTTSSYGAPVDVVGSAGDTNSVSAGYNHSCAVTASGGVKCWGVGGVLGNGSTSDQLMPVDVTRFTGGATAIALGSQLTCALLPTGGVKCWGLNLYGQLGDGTTIDRYQPANVSGLSQGVSAITTGGSHACALTAANGLKCWGLNLYGQLGDGTTIDHYQPADVSGLASGVVAADGGSLYMCALVTGGGVKCWGRNNYGQIGDNSNTDRSAPVDVAGPGGVGTLSDVVAIATGSEHACVIVTGGGVKCWGRNLTGQLGDGSTTHRLTPVDVSGLASGVVALAAGANHTCALTSGGGVKCWGGNFSGQLGDGTLDQRTTPDDVSGLTSGVTAIKAGQGHTCAILSGGALKCWGSNTAGTLGDNSTTDRSTPFDVVGLGSGVAAVDGGNSHTCAVTTQGGIKCWGTNSYGEIGEVPPTTRLTPINVLRGQSIAFAAPAPLTVGVPVALVATAIGGLAVAFDTWTPGTCSISGNMVTASAAGVCGIRASQDGNYFSSAPAPRQLRLVTVIAAAAVAPRSGFNGDARSDVFWRDSTGGLNYQWQMNGFALSGQGYMLSVPSNWLVAGIGDVNGGGIADVLWREAGGLNYLWLMNGLAVASQGYLPSVPNPWIVVGLGDASGDGKADVFWRNPTSGQNYIWIMNGLTISPQGYLPSVAGPDWEAVGVADYSGDGKADVLWRNKTTGQNYLWVMNGLVVASQGYLTTIASTDWEVVGSPDANGDSKADVLWRNKVTGQNYLWIMNGIAITSQGYLPSVADANWKVVGFGDYNGDGKGDVLWRNATTGTNYLWTLNGISVPSQGYLPSVSGTNWQPVK